VFREQEISLSGSLHEVNAACARAVPRTRCS
jgi:hypothetical protein